MQLRVADQHRITSHDKVPRSRPGRIEASALGVLTVILVTLFRQSLFEEFLYGPEDAWTRAVSFGLEFKAVTLFSLLFGIGIEGQ